MEVDETISGPKEKQDQKQLLKEMLIGEEARTGNNQTTCFGILTRRGRVFARLVDDTEVWPGFTPDYH